MTYRNREPSGIRPGHPAADRGDPADPGGEAPQREAAHPGGGARDRLGCLTRRTHAFAKEITTWDAVSRLALFDHNWLSLHLAFWLGLSQPVNGCRYD
jgi:hypothetical protein